MQTTGPIRLVLATALLAGCAGHQAWKQDRDADGVIDLYDHCPGTPRGAPTDYVGCHGDNDNDGVPDGVDRCPDTPKDRVVDYVGCAIDSDCDGVDDGLDQCPHSPKGMDVDLIGCGPGDADRIRQVTFDTDSAALDAEAIATLEKVREILRQRPDLQVRLAGHTDSRGAPDYNAALGLRRAQAVARWLTGQGTDPTRIRTLSYGQAEAPNGRDALRASRRVSITLMPPPASPEP